MTDLTVLHEALARLVQHGRGRSEVLNDITGIARQAMPGCEASSITLIRGDKPFTAAFDGQIAMDADELQYQRGNGPCIDAALGGQTLVIDDMQTEQRWPDYARRVQAHGVRSSLSIPLPFQDTMIGALNNYSRRPHAFTDVDIKLGEDIAGWVALTVSSADVTAQTAEDLANLRTAMLTRAVIEQAKGILMERHKIPAEQAFTVLTRASQDTNDKLRNVADQLVRTGALSNTG